MNTDILLGWACGLSWWAAYMLNKRVKNEVWINKYELQRLYKKDEELRRMDWKEFNPTVEVKYNCVLETGICNKCKDINGNYPYCKIESEGN